MSGKAQPCRHCGRAVVMRMTRSGRSLPFDNELIPVDSEHAEDLRYVPTPENVMAPIADLNPRRLEGVRWHAIRHVCAHWLRARQAEREGRADQSLTVNWRGEVATALHEGDTTPPAADDGGAAAPKRDDVAAQHKADDAGARQKARRQPKRDDSAWPDREPDGEPEPEPADEGGLWSVESGWPVSDGGARRRNAPSRGDAARKTGNSGKPRAPRKNGQ